VQLEGTNIIQAPVKRVYQALNDPEVLARCVPGAKKFEPDGTDCFKTSLEVAVGPVKGVFQGRVQITDKLENQAMTLKIDMRAPVGVASATGRITLESEGETTKVHWAGEPQLGGMIASIGARLIGGVAKAQADLFFAKLEHELQGERQG
jgi:uncharacterized protein